MNRQKMRFSPEIYSDPNSKVAQPSSAWVISKIPGWLRTPFTRDRGRKSLPARVSYDVLDGRDQSVLIRRGQFNDTLPG
jgi:hypothetical protein